MKKLLIICIALVALISSCMHEPDIYLLLPEEDAAAIPYKLGDFVSMVNQDGDTLLFVVIEDTTDVYHDIEGWMFADDDTKTDIIINPYPWCYGRTVRLHDFVHSVELEFTVLPEKLFIFNGNNTYTELIDCQLTGETQALTINDVTYEHVYSQQKYNSYSDEPYFQWYYSEEVGLIVVKYRDKSLTLLP